MASTTINICNYSDALIVLGTAGVVVPMVRRFGLSPVLGYLGAGALLGPLGLGTFNQKYPALFWFTISDARNVDGIAELGIVFLLFLIGLELSLQRLLAMRRLVFGLGGSQVLLTTALLAGVALLLGQSASEAVILGACLSLSSTAIVLELLSNQERLTTTVGRASFSVLFAQDLAVIPILMFISILAAGSGGSVLKSLGTALLQAVIAVAVIVVFGRVLLRPLFRLVANARSTELFIAVILFVIIAAGVIAYEAGLSMALGAFVAGLLLAETEYRKAIEATVEPFKGLLLGIFFFTVGMDIDVRELLHDPLLARRRRRRPDRHQVRAADLPCQDFPLVVAGRRRDRLAARSGRRVRLRRHRHGVGRGADRAAACQLHARRHLGDDGAHPAVILRRPALRIVAAGEPARGHRAHRAPERRSSAMPSWSATAGSARSCARCSRNTASATSQPTSTRPP